jgi:hypothetical protein
MLHVVGVDPGLVHTGVVSMKFYRDSKLISVGHVAIDGPDPVATLAWVNDPHAVMFIEGYRPRSHFSTDAQMMTAVADFKRETHATVLLNTGVKKVVKRPLMELLHVWKFTTVTHHQDLRSAARIALLGMLKVDRMNRLLTDVVSDHLEGNPWNVVDQA